MKYIRIGILKHDDEKSHQGHGKIYIAYLTVNDFEIYICFDLVKVLENMGSFWEESWEGFIIHPSPIILNYKPHTINYIKYSTIFLIFIADPKSPEY